MKTALELNSIDLHGYDKHLSNSVRSWFYGLSGKEHYRLLNDLCKDKSLVVDVGTYRGGSAVAMSSAKKVITYDVKDHLSCVLPSNVTKIIGEAMNKETLKADLILLDTFHDGVYEKAFIEYLEKNNYKGLLILDDIHLCVEMGDLWRSITQSKQDWSNLGHHSGTGAVFFN